jgi:hypothetical protein
MTTYQVWPGAWPGIGPGEAWLIPSIDPPTDATDILGLLAWAQPRARLQRMARAAATEGADHLAPRITTAAGMLDQVGAGPADVVRAEIGELRADLIAHRWENDPDRKRGAKVKASATKGGENRAAATSLKEQAETMQEAIDDTYARHPAWSYERIKQAVAKSHGYSMASLKRHTTNPRRK